MKDLVTPYISIIIPSYNSAHTIGRTLEGINSQSIKDKILEIIIVDSSDDLVTKSFLNSLESSVVKVIHSGIKVMPAKQRNIGAFAAKGELLVFIDSDAIPNTDWLVHINNAYSSGFTVGGGSYLIDKQQAHIKMVVAEYYFELGEFIPKGKIRPKRVVPSCNLFCERDFFLQIEGFPIIRASEDSLFCLNVNKYKSLYFVPDAKVTHIFRENKTGALNNLKLLGKYVIIYRKIFYPGIYNRKILLIFLLPIIVCSKFFRVYFRTLLSGWSSFKYLSRSVKELLLCTTSWTYGLWCGIFHKDQMESPEPDKLSFELLSGNKDDQGLNIKLDLKGSDI